MRRSLVYLFFHTARLVSSKSGVSSSILRSIDVLCCTACREERRTRLDFTKVHRISLVSMKEMKHGSTLVTDIVRFTRWTWHSIRSFERIYFTYSNQPFSLCTTVTLPSISNVAQRTYRIAEKSLDREENAESSPYSVQAGRLVTHVG